MVNARAGGLLLGIAQAAVVSTSGYFFYLALRAGSVIFLPMFVYSLWDFSPFSSLAGQSDPQVYFGMGLIILLQVVLIVVLVVRRHRIEPVGVRVVGKPDLA